MNRLVLTDISKTFKAERSVEVLNKANLALHPGEFVSLIGPNGCGKSTLLKIAAGITKQTEGLVESDGKISYLPQQLSLLPWKTVRQNLSLPLAIKGQKISEKRLGALLKKFGLSDFTDVYPSGLSGGMQQKLALLRAIIHKPEILLLDEPFSALDAITRSRMQLWLIKLLNENKLSVVMVTHDIREAILLSDRILVMSPRPGSIIKEIKIPFPRPRTTSVLLRPEAKKLYTRLEDLLVWQED